MPESRIRRPVGGVVASFDDSEVSPGVEDLARRGVDDRFGLLPACESVFAGVGDLVVALVVPGVVGRPGVLLLFRLSGVCGVGEPVRFAL